MPDGSVKRYQLIRFNDQQDFMFVRTGMQKQQGIVEAASKFAPGGVWVGEFAEINDEVGALVFVNANMGEGPKREEVVSLLNDAVSKVSRTLQNQLDAE